MTQRQLKYFDICHKKTANLEKMHLLPRIHKRLLNIPGRSVILNCRTSTKKILELFDSHIKGIMQESWSFIKDPNDFINKTKILRNIPEGAFLVTVEVVQLYPKIPHEARTKA